MRAKEFLFEKARGLLYRSPGDAFKNPQGDEIRFSQVTYYPSIPGEYKTDQEVDQVKQAIEQEYPGIQWVNAKTSSTKGIAVLEFDRIVNNQISGQKLYFGRFFRQIKTNMVGMWKNNELPGNWQLQKASSLKSSYKLKPIDIFEPGSTFSTPQELINTMSSSPNGQQWAQETAVLLNGKLPVYANAKDKETAIRDDLGEILSPIALIQNMINSPGALKAKEVLNDNKPWSGTIKFSATKTEGLKDSEIILPNGVTIGISSKGKTGAQASIKNAYDGLSIIKKRLQSSNDEESKGAQNLLDNYSQAIEILDIIAKNGQLDGPLVLAVRYGILDNNLVNIIKDLIKRQEKNLNSYKIDTQSKNTLLEFTTTTRSDTSNPNYNIGYHILAGVAMDMAFYINDNKNIKFGEACLKFINANPIIQIYTHTQVVGNDVKISRFDALYPPNFQGNVYLDHSKTYYSTGINGKYTFAYVPK